MLRRSLIATGCLAAALSAPLMAQPGAASPPSGPSEETIAALPLDQRFPMLLDRGRYLDAFAQIEAADPGEVSDGLRSYYRQMRPALDGFFFADPAAPALPPVDSAELAAYDGAVAQDAIAAIVARARDRRVVIVNEAHDSPRDRAFILALAEALRPLGFTHYAAETLINVPQIAATETPRLEAEGYPVRATGTYSDEPMFGYLIRRVLALGYRPVPYEIVWTPELTRTTGPDSIPIREQIQAENLARALAAAGPEAKFLVHVGYAHAAERPLPPGETEWMAARLTRLTGLDPLTIDQTDLAEVSSAKARALHRTIAPRTGGGPAVFFRDGEPVRTGRLGQATDLQVVHPLVTAVDGRPDWLRRTGRRAVAIPPELLPSAGRRLVQAFVAGEADDAIPLDQALAVAGTPPPVLYVPEGVALRWAVQD